MRSFLSALGLSIVSAGVACASPAMTVADTSMMQSPSPHAAVVQSIPANAQIDVTGCGKVWCSASWRNIAGFVRANTISATADQPPLIYGDAPPPPAPPGYYPGPYPYYGCCWGPTWGVGLGYGWGWHRHYY